MHTESLRRRDGLSPNQEKHIIRHFGENDFFQKNKCLLH